MADALEKGGGGDRIDEESQAFLDEVERLSIHYGAERSGAADDEGDADIDAKNDCGEITKRGGRTNGKPRGAERKGMVANATANQKAWSDFKKLDLSAASDGDDNSTKVSFQIMPAKAKKKKKRPKKKLIASQEGERSSPPVVSAANPDLASPSDCPRWTLVVDTSCLLHDGGMMDVKQILDLANRANNAHVAAQSERNASFAPTVDEPIHVVIPSKVWSELDYQSKNAEDDGNAYAARAAIRMLKDELEGGTNVDGPNTALRSQSLLESRDAADKFLRNDGASTNDDHILACALMESGRDNPTATISQPRGAPAAAGGVVLLTRDNDLACKAYADGLKVYDSPGSFREYYVKRMASLRQRASGRL